jgi:hypothetical protein
MPAKVAKKIAAPAPARNPVRMGTMHPAAGD